MPLLFAGWKAVYYLNMPDTCFTSDPQGTRILHTITEKSKADACHDGLMLPLA